VAHVAEDPDTHSRTVALLRAEAAAWRDAVDSREAMLATMPEAIALFEDGAPARLLYANGAARRLFGDDLAHAGDLEPAELRNGVRRVARGDRRTELTFESGGRTFEVVVTETAPPRSALVVARDVTAARLTEQLRRNFVANASHELKTPVASILGLASALERAVGDDDATRRFVAMVGREAERLASLVSDLLDLSRLEGDAGPLEPVRLDQLVAERCEKLRPDAEAAEVRLRVSCASDLRIMGRASDLGGMVDNLLSNAIRYTPPGGEIEVRLERDAGSAVVTVADSGIGIPPADIDRVFERFYRVDPARDRETGGTGLGLAIVRHVAEVHGGDVQVASAIGEGSRFMVRIPVMADRSGGNVHVSVRRNSPPVHGPRASSPPMTSELEGVRVPVRGT
jgi:two-component system, OmpR family, sensor histidine kinase SenX3